MKKSLSIFICCIIAVSTFAQTEKGSKLVGVSLAGFSYTSSNSLTTYSNTVTEYKSDGTSYSLSANPNVGWFVIKNLAVGAGVSVSFYSSESKNSNTTSTTTSKSTSTQPSFYIGPFARYYFGNNAKGMPFVQLGGQYGIYGGKSKSSTSTGSTSETKTKPKGDWNVNALFGYEFFLNQYIGLYLSTGINYGKSKTTYEYRPSTGTGYDYTSDYTRWYVPLNIGFQVHLAACKSKSKK